MSKMYILWCTSSPHTDLDLIVYELRYKYPNAMRDCTVIGTNTLCKIDTRYFSIRLADPVHTNLEGLCYDAVFGSYEKVRFEILARLKDQNAKEFFNNHRGKSAMYDYIECVINTNTSYGKNVAFAYIDTDLAKTCYDYQHSTHLPEIKNVIFNNPATIVLWADGTKTVVKVQNNERFDPEKGLAMAISKKALGNQGNYYNTFTKWARESALDIALKRLVDGMRHYMYNINKMKGAKNHD